MMQNPIVDRVTDGVAVSAVTSPVWLPGLQQLSELSGLVVPILGAIWLIIQIVGYLHSKRKK
jgi:Na+/alanine symporter